MYEEKTKKQRRKKEKKIIQGKVKNKKPKKQKKINLNLPHIKIIENDSILKKIDWKSIGIKLGILFLAMLLLIFTIARLNKHQKKEQEAFNRNIEKITEATANYFKSSPLPKNIGDSASLVLEEMIHLKLIDEIKNNNDKVCNYQNSYTITTKTGNEEYHLKIYLECPEKKKVVEKRIICNENNCTIKK